MDLTNIKISGIQFNLKKTIKRLQQDMKDDWFRDFLDYKEVFKDDTFFKEKLSEYIDSEKKYKPDPALHFDIPKPGFTIRYSSETNLIDRLMYQACVDVIADRFDEIHSERIYSHRVNKGNNGKYLFQYAIEEWRKFITDAKHELEEEDNEVLLVTDLSNYYESISIKDLITTLKLEVTNLEITSEIEANYNKVIELIDNLLSSWCEPNTRRGIPQNRDASSFLSNIFLNPVDSEMIKLGYNYFRYMDDIRIVCKDRYDARRALKHLISELRKKGLNVNSKKTKILDLNNSEQREDAMALFQDSDAKIQQIENLLKSKKARAVQIAVPMLRKKTISYIESNGTLDRHFRFCINRLESLNRIPEIRSMLDLDTITDFIINELYVQPWSSDTFAKYLISVDLSSHHLEKLQQFLSDSEKNIYEWQEYQIWRVIISHNFKHPNLIKKARENLDKRSNNSPVIASSILYLSALGDSNDKKYIVDEFKNLKNHFVQRAALIGIKELDYISFIKPSVEKHIIPSLIGCYKYLKEKCKGEYINRLPALNYKDFCEEVPEFIS